ncbi:T7SS effector LXG polymorphic toxin [Clostridium neuense]|uniref:T7SS effector LXG polymorphic toxin n=1 Tax=Clostridium neuense TaxID=1728934 RepID=A0ABW8TCR1_9CLOT
MGLIYSSSDSENLINGLSANVGTAKAALEDLVSASQSLTSSIGSGKALDGSAFNAGKDLFSALIIPTIHRASAVFDDTKKHLSQYESANEEVSGEGVLDEDKLNAKKRSTQAIKAETDNTASTLRAMASAADAASLFSVASSLNEAAQSLENYSESLQQDLDKIEDKLRKLYKFNSAVNGLFNDDLNNFKLVVQTVAVLNETVVNVKTGSYTLPEGSVSILGDGVVAIGEDPSKHTETYIDLKEEILDSNLPFLEKYKLIGEITVANWLDDTTPLSDYTIAGHKIPVVPSTSDVIAGCLEKVDSDLRKLEDNPIVKDIYAYSLSGLGLSGLGTVVGNSDRIAKKTWGHVNKEGVITDLSPKGSLEEIHPYEKSAKVTGNMAKGLTLGSLGLDVANTWTVDSGNTNEKRLEKTAIQVGGGLICYGTGKATSAMAVSGFANPEFGGWALIPLAVGIDTGVSAGVAWGEDWLYKKWDIK